MAAIPDTLFDSIYSYIEKNGTIVPETDTVKTNVRTGLRTIFGANFSTDTETPAGRFLEALALLFVDVCGVNAQGGQLVNPNAAAGNQLDFLGAMFNVSRGSGETDESYRKKIIASASRGSGFAESIRQKLSSDVEDIGNIVVIGNGDADPAMLPLDEYGNPYPHSISVSPHSVYLAFTGITPENKNDMLRAIRATKSAGCAYDSANDAQPSAAAVHTDSITENGNTFQVKWHEPVEKALSITATVDDGSYTGANIVTDTTNAINNLLASNTICATITKPQIVAAIASAGKGIVCTNVEITYDLTPSDRIVIMPYQFIDPEDEEYTTIQVVVS